MGFCDIGEAKDFLEGGKNIARDGVLPLNTHGGQLSHGRTHGMGLEIAGTAGAPTDIVISAADAALTLMNHRH